MELRRATPFVRKLNHYLQNAHRAPSPTGLIYYATAHSTYEDLPYELRKATFENNAVVTPLRKAASYEQRQI